MTRLGKRLYDDELKLVDEDGDGRRRYRDLRLRALLRGRAGHRPGRGRAGADLAHAVHFDLTDRAGLGRLREWDLDRMFRDALAGAAKDP